MDSTFLGFPQISHKGIVGRYGTLKDRKARFYWIKETSMDALGPGYDPLTAKTGVRFP
jgi:hypothetical protein